MNLKIYELNKLRFIKLLNLKTFKLKTYQLNISNLTNSEKLISF